MTDFAHNRAPGALRTRRLAVPSGHQLGQHLAMYWAVWIAFAGAGVAAWIGLETGFERLVERWSFRYSHAWLVIAMSAWLFARSLSREGIERIRPSLFSLAAVCVMTLGYAAFVVLDFTLGMQLLIPAILLGVVATIGGPAVAVHAWAPVALLYFAVPIWDYTSPALQAITTVVVTAALSLTNISAYIQGYLVTVPAGVFEIAEGCSGMRYVVVSLAMAAFYGLAWYRRWSSRLTLLVLALVAAMISNWIRVFSLIVIGDMTNMQHYLIAESHDGFGWLVFVVSMAPVLWFALWLEHRESGARVHGRASVERRPAVAPTMTFLGMAALLATVLAAPALLRVGAAVPMEPRPIALPELAPTWTMEGPSTAWNPEYQHPHFEAQALMTGPAGVGVDVYVARYLRQLPDAKLLANANTTIPDPWRLAARGKQRLPFDGAPRYVHELELESRGERRLVWQWYWIGGRTTHDRNRAKLLELPALLSGRRDGAVIAISAACSLHCDTARAALADFWRAGGPELDAIAGGRSPSRH